MDYTGAGSNIVLIVADDMGYSDIGCYGSEIPTPNIDRLGLDGVRFTQFYNHARCCPTRASLMTGLSPHQTGLGHMTANDLGHFGYRGELNFQCVTIAEVLKEAGYATYMSGKWHLTSREQGQDTENWPVNRGFDSFYGMVGGAGSFYDPHSLARNGQLLPSPKGAYNFTDAVTEEAIGAISSHRNEPPFFLYLAYTAPHWPLHAAPKDIARFKGLYKDGWDKTREERRRRMVELGILQSDWPLTPRDPAVPAWEDAKAKAWQQRRMEVYAAQLHAMDRGIGKVVQALEKRGELDNTLLFFLADNGACAEKITPHWSQSFIPKKTRTGGRMLVGNNPKVMPGPENTYQSYGPNWANVSNTPFRLYKHWTHEGGIATPLIMHWPNQLKNPGRLFREPGHLPDIMATCVAAAGATYPSEFHGNKIPPCEGTSLLPALGDAPLDRPGAICWEHEGNRAVRRGKWKLVAEHHQEWELYDMEADRTEMNNLAAQRPEIARELMKEYGKWAARTHVLDWPPTQAEAVSGKQKASRKKIESETDWKIVSGDWWLKGGELRQSHLGMAPTRALLEAPVSGSFTYELEAKKSGGKEGFLILFNHQDGENLAMWNIGGWDNSKHGFQIIPDGSPVQQVPGSVKTGRWYKIKIEVGPGSVKCFLDGKLIHDYSGMDLSHGQLGVGTWKTSAVYRNIKVVRQPSSTPAAPTYRNPLVEKRGDPWIYKAADGTYYFIATAPEYDRILLRRATTIDGLATATEKTVWTRHASGSMSHLVWAPELHRVNGAWTILFAASSSREVFDVRMHVLVNPGADPFSNGWKEAGQIQTPFNSFALDATTFEHNGKRYLVWAQKPPGTNGQPDRMINSALFIAEWDGRTKLKSKPVELTRPELAWERQIYNVNEGPAVLVRNGKVFLAYSASATDHNYCMGLLWADAAADLLDAASWTKSQWPVFRSNALNSQYGPGHNGFTVSEDGQTDLLVYHARNYKAINGPALANPDRHARIKPIRWKKDGMPDFGVPPKDTVK